MRKVTFKNKVENLGTTYTGKAWAADFNEIKEVVNENADITTITMAVSADLVGNTLYFKNYLDQIIYQVDVSSILTSLGLVDLNDVEFTMPLGEGHAPVFSQLVNKFVNKKVSLDGHNHDSLYSPIDHNHNSLYAPLSHSNITSGNPHGVSYSNILGDVPFYTKSESDLKYHIKGGSYTEDFLAQTISSKKSITETLIIPTGNPLLSPGEWALTMTDNGWGGEPPIGGTVGFLGDLADVTLVAPIGDLQVLGRSSGQWANINLTIGHISGLSTSLGNVYTKSESDARYPILSYGLIPSSYLPSYVDDIIEVSTFSALPATGETGKIYVTLDTNLTYRWSGSGYTEISKSLALGETDSTAYRGDRGKIAYDHSLITSGNPHGVSYSNITGTAPFYTKTESDANYHPKYGTSLLDFTAKKLKSQTLIIPTNASPELLEGEWALVMTNNGFSGEPPAGGVVGYLDDLIDVSLSSPVVNQFLFHNGTSWINSYLTSLLITTALGYTPYNSTNPSGYISAITGTMVQAVLSGEITSHYHDGRYYTESEINNFFNGVTTISGYNKTNWDTAYTKSHNILTLGTANGLSLSTQVLSLGLASSSTTGALSLTDWNTFNSKQAALNGTGFVKISGTTISYDNSTYLTTSSAASLYHPKNGSISLAFSALSLALAGAITGATDITASGKLTSGTLIIPTGVPSLSAGQWALTMTNNGFSGEAPVGGVVGYLDDLQDVSLSTLATNQFLQYNGSSWVNALISGSQVITALGYTPYNSTNPNGYISGITSAMVTTALGYTPESYLNLPSTNGYLLSSTTTGVRSWVAPYSLPLATSGTRGGIQIGYAATGANLPVALSSEKAYIALTKSAIESVLTGAITSHTHSYEAPITAGTTLQYWRGDKSWQTLNTLAVPELTNLYFTEARVRASLLTGFAVNNTAILATDSVLVGFNKAQGQINARALTNQTFYIGTTQIAINRTSASLSLTGVSIDGNSATTTKLLNARTIWGQSFDGTANVSGAITGATDVTASGRVKSGTLLIPTGVPNLNAGEWALVMTNNGFGGEPPEGGVVGYLNDLIDVSISSPLINQFLYYNGSTWTNFYLSSSQITSALGFTPYNSTNPSGFISGITGSMVNTALGYTAQPQLNGTGLVRMSGTGITYDNNSYALVSSLSSHTGSIANPHSVTAAQVGALPITGGDISGETLALNASRQGGWAYGYSIKHSGSQVLELGWYGENDVAQYGFLVLNGNYSSTNAIRIYPTYASWGNNVIYHAGNLLNIGTTASSARDALGLGTMALETASNYLTTATAASTYLPLSGGVLTLDGAISKKAYVGGTWARQILRFENSTASIQAGLGAYGTADSISYMYLGFNASDSNNLRVYSDKVQFGNSLIYHSGNSNSSSVAWAASTFTEGGTLLSNKYLGISAKAADSTLFDGISVDRFVYGSSSVRARTDFSDYNALWQAGFYSNYNAANAAHTGNFVSLLMPYAGASSSYRYGMRLGGWDNLYHQLAGADGSGTWFKIWSAYNSNSTTKDWSAQNLTLAGSITGATDIDASGRVKPGTLLVPTGTPSLIAGEWALVMTNNGFSGEAPEGGIVGTLNDLSDVTIASPVVNHFLTYNGSQWINALISSSQVTTALGYTPYNSANPSNYISGITGNMVTTALGYTPYNSSNPSGYISGITGSMVNTALGYTAQEQLNGTGLVRMSGTGVTYDNTSYATVSHNHSGVYIPVGGLGLLTDSLSVLNSVVTTSNFRTSIFGAPTNGWQIKAWRWNDVPSLLLGKIGSYGSAIVWAASDTHGFLGLDYYTANAVIGGGNGDLINWTATLLHSSNFNAYASPSGHTHSSFHNTSGYEGNVNDLIQDFRLVYTPYIKTSSSNLFPISNNANAILSIATHVGGYNHQLGFSSDGSIYSRQFSAGTPTTWRILLDASNFSAYTSPLDHAHDDRYYTETESDSRYALSSTLTSHINNTSNPHSVTFSQLGGKPTTLSGYGISSSDTLFDLKYLGIGANAVSATKLLNARTIWGQSFDGTGNVSGAITGATDVTASARLKSGTLLIPTGSPSLLAGEWALVMTNNGFSGEAPEGGIVGTLNDLSDVTISSPLVNHFLTYNGSQWINSYLSSSQITTALGFTPYNSSNPSGYISGISGNMVTTALGFTPYNSSNPSNYISGITKPMVEGVLTGNITTHDHNSTYYTETEIGQFFSGAVGINGYNRSNWDSAHSYSQVGHLPLSGGGLTGMLYMSGANYLSLTGLNYNNVAIITGNWGGSGQWGFGSESGHILKFDVVSGNSFLGYSDITLKLGTKTVIDSVNIGSQSVNYATSANASIYADRLRALSGYDPNAITGGGVISNYGSTSYWVNLPAYFMFGSIYHLEGARQDGLLSTQLGFDTDNNFIFRIRNVSAWDSWKKVWHDGNLTSTLSSGYLPYWNGSSLVNSGVYMSESRFFFKYSDILPVLRFGELSGIMGVYSSGQLGIRANGGLKLAGGDVDVNLNPHLMIAGNGNIGIGTTDPHYKLSFGSGVGDKKLAFHEYEAGGGTYFYGIGSIEVAGVRGVGIWGGTETGTPSADLATMWISRWNDGGRVQIGFGNTLKTEKFAVNGSGYFNGNLSVSGYLSLFTGSASGTTFMHTKQANHQYLHIEGYGNYESMVRYTNTNGEWYVGMRVANTLSDFQFYSTTTSATVASLSTAGDFKAKTYRFNGGSYEIGTQSGRFSFSSEGVSSAIGANMGSLLVSDVWADASNVPTNGIYSKGIIQSAASVTAPTITATTVVNSPTFYTGGYRPVSISSGYVSMRSDAGEYDMRYGFIGSSGTDRGGFGAYGNADGLEYYYIGSDYSDWIVRFEPSNKMTSFWGGTWINGPLSIYQGSANSGYVIHAKQATNQYFWIEGNGSYEAMLRTSNSNASWYVGLRTANTLSDYQFYNDAVGLTVASLSTAGALSLSSYLKATSIKIGANWEAIPNENDLELRYGGVMKAKLASDGTITTPKLILNGHSFTII